eukprot:CAMPEP_0119121926 /NCGR_PEP_ID=MMETSP1310-20130426/2340_1 /TAXON_ID=464262 /ORGANISM="Genus nov. species nov., Strain RCC2339" /LENGTH=93 /DNA_ID=CAMNT_0007111521 /DNA_START=94 /DNA_END=375 /DNA_ORIENTATION=+
MEMNDLEGLRSDKIRPPRSSVLHELYEERHLVSEGDAFIPSRYEGNRPLIPWYAKAMVGSIVLLVGVRFTAKGTLMLFPTRLPARRSYAAYKK